MAGQSQRSEGVTSHMSGCSTPLLTGLPSKLRYGPERQQSYISKYGDKAEQRASHMREYAEHTFLEATLMHNSSMSTS